MNFWKAESYDIAVITPYGAQSSLLRQALIDFKVTVGTIDAFQGVERDVAIISAVRANYLGNTGFSNDKR